MSGKKIIQGVREAIASYKDTTTLNDNDLALAWFACAHASHFWTTRGSGPYAKNEAAKYDALSTKLNRLLDEKERIEK